MVNKSESRRSIFPVNEALEKSAAASELARKEDNSRLTRRIAPAFPASLPRLRNRFFCGAEMKPGR
jgi:hypothetical protein